MVATEIANIEYICDYCNFQKVQEWLSEASNLSIITADFKGNPITVESNFSEHCTLVRTNEELNHLCLKCDSRGGLEAAREGKPYIYLCHMGLVDFAIPIIINGQYLVTILAGQIVLKDDKENALLEKVAESSNIPLSPEFKSKLKELRRLLPVKSLETIEALANMIFKVAKSMIQDAQEETEQNMVFIPRGESDDAEIPANVMHIKIPKCDSPLLEPALTYINKNYAQKISLDSMAELCNISSSYFSKLFNKMVGENFNNYINIVRIKNACDLLTNTSLPITVIALDIGFEDSSYFNQVFKHLTGMTPTYYRAINRTRAADNL